MTIDKKIKLELKSKAHHLKPIILIGNNGLSENVKVEINRALDDHELIKIRLPTNDRVLKKMVFNEICESLTAEKIQTIGHTIVIYRKNLNKTS